MRKICDGNTESRWNRKKKIRKESGKKKTERRNGGNKLAKRCLFTFFRPDFLSNRLLSEIDCIVCRKERFNGSIYIVFIFGAALCDLYEC